MNRLINYCKNRIVYYFRAVLNKSVNFKRLDMYLFKLFLCCCLFLCSIESAVAQIVNIEDKRAKIDSNKIVQGQFDVSSKFTKSSNTVFELSSAFRLDRTSNKNTYLLLANYNFIRAKSENFIDDGFVHLRYTRNLKSKLSWEAFNQVQYNQKLRINLRVLLGTGPRLELIRDEKKKIAVGAMFMYEYNELDDNLEQRRDSRLSSFLTIRLKILKDVSFSSTTYYQPLLSDFKESRLSTVNTLGVKINQFLSLTSSFSLVKDALLSKNFNDVPVSTYQWRNGLRLIF